MVRIDERDRPRRRGGHRRQRPLCRLDPYDGRQLALAEAYRNVATTGARPLAVTELPELRVAGGPGGDVAVRGGGARAGGRLPASSASR